MSWRHIYRNLLFASDGQVWAVWRVEPAQYRNVPEVAKHEVLHRTETLLRSLPAGEALLLSLCGPSDPDVLCARMLTGVERREWTEACESYAHTLGRFHLSERSHWLALPLPGDGTGWGLLTGATRAFAGLASRLGLTMPPVSARQLESAVRGYERVSATLPSGWLRPADPAEILWIARRAPLRGVAEPTLERGSIGTSDIASDGVLRGPSLTSLEHVLLDEGGRRGRRLSLCLGRRYLEVVHPDYPEDPSFQVFSVLAEMPGEFIFPGSEFLEHVEDFPFPVDWAARLSVVPRDRAEATTRRRARELSEQTDQRADESGAVPEDLERAIGDMSDYRARLSASASEVEIQSTIIFCTFDHDLERASEYADTLHAEYAPSDYQLVRPTGGQADLYTAMLPGYPVPRMLADYTQYHLAKDFAMAVPFARTELGDPTGGLLGIRIDSSGTAPVLYDPSYGPRVLHTSASSGAVGNLGSGKSVVSKLMLDMNVRRGGRALVVDRTPLREWSTFTAVVPGRKQIVDISPRAEFSLDPTRVFQPDAAQRYTEGFLGLLLGIEGLSSEGALLSEAIEETLTESRPSLARMVEALRAKPDPGAEDLGRRLAAAQRLDLSRCLFDRSLAPLEVTEADIIVFATSAIALPDREELATELGARQIAPEKRLGRAVMYLVAALCRELAFGSERFAGIYLDECYWLTSSAEGERLALELVRDGRKHNAAVHLAAHDPEDLGSATISGLLGQKILLRHRDVELAKRGLEWLGLEPDEDLIHLVTRNLSPIDLPADQAADRSGECLCRDCSGRIGLMQVVIPDLPGLPDAIRTDPGEHGGGT